MLNIYNLLLIGTQLLGLLFYSILMIMAQLHWLYEEAIILNKGSEEKVTMGTGVYIVQARISRLVPNVLPIQGNMIKV